MCLSRSQQSDDPPSPGPEPRQEEIEFRPLALYHARDDCYWPQPDNCRKRPETAFRPILISTDLLFCGGFMAGMKLASDPRLLIVFVDEKGRMFEGQYGFHRPRRVLHFLPRGFVRLRLFGTDFSWRPLDKMALADSSYRAHVAIAVTDSEGERHHFVFSATGEIRGLFPNDPAEVT